uniref:Helicase ATP-binding domain-containing protein n=1 Tax=Globisporangium ultimum (strain ATCC 200006 / CBS 805.95 / DAOM BR144) TaxID=431595 RepID=K3W6Y0_GLOUD
MAAAHANDAPRRAESASGAAAADEDAVAQDKAFFSFPYDPYAIQLQLMQQLYATIDSQHVGIFESPTGTGKSISLICGALSWLTKHTDEYGLLRAASAHDQENSGTVPTTDGAAATTQAVEPNWLARFDQDHAQREAKQQQVTAKAALRGIEAIRAEPSENTKKRKIGFAYNHQERQRRQVGGPTPTRRAGTNGESKADDEDGDEHVVDAYDSDRVEHVASSDSESELKKPSTRRGPPEPPPEYGVVKIIYCSRTHSQISQFVREIRKTVFGDHIRVVSLGSRKNLCTNPSVASLRSDLQMTDKCLDMLQGAKKQTKAAKQKKKATGKCPFYDKELLGYYKDYALAHVHDIEELHELGDEMSICSYYGTRESVPLAQVIAMPYSMLLSKDTRESLGVALDGNIVILDEAHNIIEAINSTYSIEVTSKQLVVARRSLWSYFKKYETRLKGKNTFYIKQLLSVLELLTKFLRLIGKSSKTTTATNANAASEEGGTNGAKMMPINDFLFSAKVDHFNMFKIIQYLSQSGLAKKLLGFLDAENTLTQAAGASTDTVPPPVRRGDVNDDDDVFQSRHISPLRTIEALLKALTSAGGDGRILAQPPQPAKGIEGAIKFILMNPAIHFEEIVEKARSVILAGGTMQPVSQVIDQLFSKIPRDRIDLFSCGHVIPPKNLVGFSLSNGPSQRHLEFTFARRGDTEALDELGRILLNLARIVPGGIVVFFPSYRFEEMTVQRWQTTTQFHDLNARKQVFREPKQTDELARVLSQYSAACTSPCGRGAMLLSVVGGKMSEGINFSDDLARCVVMVGLPYPNARDAELVEKMEFLDKRTPGAGRQYYESLCMKAVNQSIGRSIRHQNDYASIVLVDHRYASPIVRKRLPEWIQVRVQPPAPSFGHVYAQLVQFYRAKDTQATASLAYEELPVE